MKRFFASRAAALAVVCSPFSINLQAQDAAPTPAPAAEEKAPAAEEKVAAADPSVVATVDGRKILHSDVERRVVGQYAQQLAQLPEDQQAFMRARAERQAVSDLIDRAVLANAATKEEKFKASEAAIDQRMTDMKGQLPAGADLNQALEQLGLTEASLREEIRVELAINSLIEAKLAEVKEPSAEEVKKFYEDNPTFFTKGATATARHILVSTQGTTGEEALAAKKAEAEKLRAKLIGEKAEPFEKVASEHSDCPSKAEGGMLGEFEKGRMVPEFETAAFGQKVGEIGPLVKTDFGYHIIRVEERSDGEVAAFEEVSETLPGYLAGQRKQEAVESYVKELRDAAEIVETAG